MSIFSKKSLQGIVWREGRQYVSQCLNVDVASFGKTKNEAIANLQEAVELYFENEPSSHAKIVSVMSPELVAL